MSFKQDETFHAQTGNPRPIHLEARVTRQASGTHIRSTLNITSPAARLEVEDAFFNHNSAVMMPDTIVHRRAGPRATEPFHAADSEFMALLERFHPEVHRSFTSDPPDPKSATNRHIGGLGTLAAVYRFLELNSSFRLLLAGHCDTSGHDDYNFVLSENRARNVLFLLTGDREAWVASALRHSQVEDQKRICRHAARERGWPCDPGQINSETDEHLTRALRAFRESYNRHFGRSIPLDGPADRQTWGAFFDAYMDELANILDCQVDSLSAHREKLRFVDEDHPLIACGERHPIVSEERGDFRSEENRRVELLFFSMKALPDLHCHAESAPYCMRTCSREECGVYSPLLYSFIPIMPSMVGPRRRRDSDGTFEILDIDDDLSKLADQPDEDYVTRFEVRDVDPTTDPWAFLSSFMDLDPEHALHETRRQDETTAGDGTTEEKAR